MLERFSQLTKLSASIQSQNALEYAPTSLLSLELSNCGNFLGFPALTRISKLTELDMLGCNINGEAVERIPRTVKRLWLDRMGNIKEESLKHLPNQLTFLGLVDSYRIEEIAHFLPTTLKELHLGQCSIKKPVFLPPNLQWLELVGLEGSYLTAIQSIPSSVEELLIGFHFSSQWEKLEFIPKNMKILRLTVYDFSESIVEATEKLVKSLGKIFEVQQRNITIILQQSLQDNLVIEVKPEGKRCSCGLPVIYKPKYWQGKTPKELLEAWYKKNYPKSVPKYEQHISSNSTSFGSKVILPHLKEFGRPKEIISQAFATNKKESEQNAALAALHFLQDAK